MPNQHTITVPISQATDRQLLVELFTRVASIPPDPAPTLGVILERITVMAEQIDRLNAAVDQELADDAAQNELIAELRAQVGQARAAAEAAEAGNTSAQAELMSALNAVDAAAARLESNDPQRTGQEPSDPTESTQPEDPEPQPEPQPEPDPDPNDPTQPEQPEPGPVEPAQPEQPTP